MKLRQSEDIISTLKLIQTSKLSISQSTMLLSGIVYALVLDREIFKRNADLNDFTLKIFKQWLPNQEQFRPYVFRSRTILGSKLSRIILEKFDYESTKTVSSLLLSLFSINTTDKKDKNKQFVGLEKTLAAWLDSLGNVND